MSNQKEVMSNQFDYVAPGAKSEKFQDEVLKEVVNSDSKNSQQFKDYMYKLLQIMLDKKASDMFITADFPAAIKLNGDVETLNNTVLTHKQTESLVLSIMNDYQRKEYLSKSECNFAIAPPFGRFRVNAFRQQGHAGMVLRRINTIIPKLEDLGVPIALRSIIMEKRGLVIIVGATGSGKSTTLAAMLGYRNANQAGHIITIEDPIEFVHPHNKSIFTQREVGVDTESWEAALKNTLRQAPDVILIGEIRDKETMEYAVAFAETGHLCIATLHANNANQALDRIVNFFPEEKRQTLLMDLSLNLKAIVSQRLIPSKEKGRVPAVEILLNTPYISDLIFKGEVLAIKEAMKKGRESGMQTFDQALFDLFEHGSITYEDALRNADSTNDIRLDIKLKSNRIDKKDDSGPLNLKFE